jgi:ABC-2 type transport system ATP-binding protein
MAGAAIEAESLVKTFKGGVKALNGVSFEVAPASVFGMLGPNGAGKTTAVRILTTILRPDSGFARVLGTDVTQHPAKVRSMLGLAGQYAAVDENLTGLENLRMIGQLCQLRRKESARRARELLEQFDLSDAATRSVKTYSGGMRRRLDLAAALVDRPPVLFLDEPTTGLDPFSRTALWQVIEELVKQGTTVLLTTQYLEEADRLADQLVVIDKGVVIAEGTSSELKGRLGASRLDLDLASEEDAEKARGVLAERMARTITVRDSLVELGLENGSGDVIEALRLLEAAEIVPLGLRVREPSLDDVFLALTGHGTEES